jgi:hypothetical protein
MTTTTEVTEPIKLSTGATVIHSRMANGAQSADVEGGRAMTEGEWQEYCEKRAAAPKPIGGYEAGAIIESSWGYDQTNIDFFQIAKRSGDWVSLIPLNSKTVDRSGPMMTSKVMPGEPMKPGDAVSCVSQNWNGKPIRRKLAFRDGKCIGLSIKHGWANLWDGKPGNATHYA